jgi:NADH-quinone oxidoreductase subunit J
VTTTLFYVAAAIALMSTAMALSRTNAAHALIYLIVSLLSVAVIFFIIGAPFAAALEIVIYAGAIMVLFVFVIMMLNLGEAGQVRERQWLQPGAWLLPGVFALVLLAELLLLESGTGGKTSGATVEPREVGLSLFGTYVLAVELASMLLLAGLVGAYHIGRTFLARNRGAKQG